MATPVVTVKGIAKSTTANATLTVANLTFATGDAIFLSSFADGVDPPSPVTWGGTTLNQIQGGDDGIYSTWIFAAFNVTGGTHDVVAHFAGVVHHAIDVIGVSHLSSTVLDQASESDTSTTPAAPCNALGPGVAIAAVGTEGPVGDAAGTWINSFVPADRDGTSLATLSTATRISSASNATAAGKTGITSRAWMTTQIAVAWADQSLTLDRASASGVGYALEPYQVGYGLGPSVANPNAAIDGWTATTVDPPPPGYVPVPAPVSGGISLVLPPSSSATAAPLPVARPYGAVAIPPDTNSPTGIPGGPAFASLANRAAGSFLRSLGVPYFAATNSIVPLGEDFGQSQHSYAIIFAAHKLPTQLHSPDEVHPIFSLFEVGGLKFGSDLFYLGVTPNGRIVVSNFGESHSLATSIATVLADGSFHLVRLDVDFGANTRNLTLDGASLVSDGGFYVGVRSDPANPPIIPSSATWITMLFNGRTGITRFDHSIAYATWMTTSYAVEWPLNEGTGTTLGYVESQGGSHRDQTLALKFYDPSPNPNLYPLSTSLSGAYAWERAGVFNYRNPANPIYRPIARPV